MHFSHVPSHRPELSELQLGVVEYLILRGVTIEDRTSHPSIDVFSTDRELLRAYDDLLGWLSNGIRLYKDSDTTTKRLNDVYAISTIPHPELENYAEGSTSVKSLSNSCLKATSSRWSFVGEDGTDEDASFDDETQRDQPRWVKLGSTRTILQFYDGDGYGDRSDTHLSGSTKTMCWF